ncbi:hypothetical protein HC931_12385 [Candidatus Gracilibacteria bacterium]|nr:hypothetical protein [Candidatus Gracilibacteria bacterium]NJM88506.1 hypothetical protein [Hydrococcus sp. RU_2_2]
MTNLNQTTNSPAYAFNVPDGADGAHYDIRPLLSVGDEIPYLEGDFGNFTPSQTKTFALAGETDGLGYTQINGLNYLWANHEIADDITTDISSTVAGKINGARVSLFVFDRNWNPIGGKNLLENVKIDGVEYSLNTGTGNYEDANGNVLDLGDRNNFSRFCAGYLAASGFVGEDGKEIPLYFAPEEVDTGLAVPVTPDGTGTPLISIGAFAKEKALPASQYRATNSDYTVLLSPEDEKDNGGNGEVYLYVGRQTAENPNGLTENPDDFQLYVLQVVDPTTGEVFGYETMPENRKLIAQWNAVPDDIALNRDPSVLSNWVDVGTPGVSKGNFTSTNFRAVEDLEEDPNKPGTFYFAATGRNEDSSIPPGETNFDNLLGKLHRVTVAIDPKTGTPLNGSFETLLAGGANKGVSYDNISIDRNGNVLIQEDETSDGGDVMEAEGRNAGVWRYNIAKNEGVIGSDSLDFLFELDQKAAGAEFDTETGAWESSGLIEAGSQNGQSSYLFNVMASTIDPNDDDLPPEIRQKALEILGGNYAAGGQLILTIPAPVIDLNKINNDDDDDDDDDDEIKKFSASNKTEIIKGTNNKDIINGNGGDDLIDGKNSNDTLSGGDGKDEIYGGAGRDAIYGNKGNDFLFGQQDRDNINGGEGDDLIQGGLGQDSLKGDRGSDTFVLTAGEGTDTIVDFTVSEDFIGLANGLTFEQLSIVGDGNNTRISVNNEILANLSNVNATTITESSFVTS